MTRRSLARIDQRGLQLHRLTQAILRDRLSPADASATRVRSEAILAANNPGGDGPYDPATWPAWARLIPHLLAADLAGTTNSGLRKLTCDASAYLAIRGDARTGYDLTSRAYNAWRRRGDDDSYTWAIGNYLAWALRHLRRYAEAHDLDQDILARRRAALGEDNHDTLQSATHLALDLHRMGEMQAACDLNRDTLARSRRALGENHPDTLVSALNFAWDLRALGEVRAAHDLDEDILARFRRILGEDHPLTFEAANSLADDLYALGDVQAACDLNEDTLARRRRVLGEDHPDTLESVGNLERHMGLLGEPNEDP
jgi:hypothetical protein